MSISNIIQSIRTHLSNAYNKLEEKGATIPQNKNIENLTNSIDSISGGGGWKITDDFNTKAGTTHRYSENVLLPNITTEVSSRYVWSKDYTYSGSIQSVQMPKTGRYLLEAWGGQGQNAGTSSGSIGGYGGYATGEVELQAGTTLYICCGGQGNSGTNATSGATSYSGGYNGGGNKPSVSQFPQVVGGAGGGATHIALRTSTLSNIGLSNLSDVLIVAGGGGGGVYYSSYFKGGNGGGTIGTMGTGVTGTQGQAGTPSSGGTSGAGLATITKQAGFGYGASGGIAGGGGGLYGGGAGNVQTTSAYGSGGGGSGYLNSLLTNASMKNSGTASSTPRSNYLKQGAGAVHIELLEEIATYSITATITNGTASGDTDILENGTATLTISANSGYDLPSSITVSGASYTYDSTTGVINLSSPTDDITINVVCESSGGITDLTNTTWIFNNTVNINNSSQLGNYDINYHIICEDTNYNANDGTEFTIAYESEFIPGPGAGDRYVAYIEINTSNYEEFGGAIMIGNGRIFEKFMQPISPTYPVTLEDTSGTSATRVNGITITGGTDTTNTSLIDWLQENATQISGYSVIVTNNTNENVEIYDGQDNTGTYLGTILANATETYTITSGYIYLDSVNYAFSNGTITTNPMQITENTTIEIISYGSLD